MTNPEVGILMLGLFIFIILLGFPIAFTLIAMGVSFGLYAMQSRIFDLLVTNTMDVMSNDVLVAVPLFLFMGYLVERSNILDRLFYSIQMAARHIPGSLAVATLVTCSLFATATGIVGAVVTLMGLLALPPMLRAGYDVRLATGVIAAGGCLGIMIPPSIMLILFGATAGVSVVQLYAAAFVPGVMLAGLYIAYAVGVAMVKPRWAPRLPPEETQVPFGTILLSLLTSFLPLALLIASVLGAILLGLATPSEAAAMGSLGSVLLAVAYRSFTWAKLRESVFLTARTSAMVCWLFVGSAIFSSVFGYLGGQALVESFFKSLPLNSFTFMILAQFLIFLLGWPLEWTEIIIIFVPIFLPLLQHFQIDPVLWGVLVFVNLQAAFLSPPVAMAAFYLKGVAPPHITINQIFAGMMPYMLIVILCMVIIYIFPGITLWLPDYLYGR